jgi:hypothetical protein
MAKLATHLVYWIGRTLADQPKIPKRGFKPAAFTSPPWSARGGFFVSLLRFVAGA